jgi:hypothetical protein
MTTSGIINAGPVPDSPICFASLEKQSLLAAGGVRQDQALAARFGVAALAFI